MNKWVELLLGLIIIVGMILIGWASSAYSWTILGKDLNLLHSAWILFKGGIFWFLISIGIVLILLGISDLKD
jgi:hypothetical protein